MRAILSLSLSPLCLSDRIPRSEHFFCSVDPVGLVDRGKVCQFLNNQNCEDHIPSLTFEILFGKFNFCFPTNLYLNRNFVDFGTQCDMITQNSLTDQKKYIFSHRHVALWNSNHRLFPIPKIIEPLPTLFYAPIGFSFHKPPPPPVPL